MHSRMSLLLVDNEPKVGISLIVIATPSLLFIRMRWNSHDGNGMNPIIVISLWCFMTSITIPPTGAGVEREFSKSGWVVTWTRSRLNVGTISEIMLFKNFLTRKGDAISEWDDARCRGWNCWWNCGVHGCSQEMEETLMEWQQDRVGSELV